MLILRSITASYIRKWRVSLDDTLIDQALQWHDMSRIEFFKPLSAESEGSKLLIYHIKKTFCLGISDHYIVVQIKFSHIVTAVQVFVDVTSSCRAESFDGVLFAFHHSRRLVVLNNVDTLASMNFVPLYAMTTEVLNGLDRVRFVSNLDFEGLHCLLNLLSNF